MRLLVLRVFLILVLCSPFSGFAQESDEVFTIYLVRHSEKEFSAKMMSGNPELTKCGQERAESMATLLADVDLDAVYSTNYIRTINTAQPTASTQDLEIQMYNPRNLEGFAKKLIDKGEDAFVVGHSNTTGVLAGLLAGEDIGPFDETIYNRIYQVVIYKNIARLNILHTSFSCKSKNMTNNKYPMRVAMVSVMVEDPVKAFKYYTETLGFEEVMYSPENYIAIVKSPIVVDGPMILLEPTEPGGIEIAKKFKTEIYEMGLPVISFGCDDIKKTVEELKKKGVKFKKNPTKTDFGYEAVFDDDNGNFIQLLQLN